MLGSCVHYLFVELVEGSGGRGYVLDFVKKIVNGDWEEFVLGNPSWNCWQCKLCFGSRTHVDGDWDVVGEQVSECRCTTGCLSQSFLSFVC